MKRYFLYGAIALLLAGGWLYYEERPVVAVPGERVVVDRAIADFGLSLLQKSLKGLSSQVAAAIEKQTGVDKESQQADLNYAGTVAAAKTAAIADDAFPDPEASEAFCRIEEEQSAAVDAKVASDIWSKSLVASNLNNALAGRNASVSTKMAIDSHNSTYCSGEDSLQGRCVAPGNGMENADLMVGTVLVPNLGMTLSEEEYKAALLASRNIVNPVPIENMPPAIERAPGGDAFLIQKRAAEATLSLADQSFAQMIARRRSRTE